MLTKKKKNKYSDFERSVRRIDFTMKWFFLLSVYTISDKMIGSSTVVSGNKLDADCIFRR